MKIFTWNVRGLNSPNKTRLVKNQIVASQAEVCMLKETKLDKEGVMAFGKRMGP